MDKKSLKMDFTTLSQLPQHIYTITVQSSVLGAQSNYTHVYFSTDEDIANFCVNLNEFFEIREYCLIYENKMAYQTSVAYGLYLYDEYGCIQMITILVTIEKHPQYRSPYEMLRSTDFDLPLYLQPFFC